MELDEVIVRLEGLRSEFERKSEEVWSRGLEHGYDSSNENGKTATALELAIRLLKSK